METTSAAVGQVCGCFAPSKRLEYTSFTGCHSIDISFGSAVKITTPAVVDQVSGSFAPSNIIYRISFNFCGYI